MYVGCCCCCRSTDAEVGSLGGGRRMATGMTRFGPSWDWMSFESPESSFRSDVPPSFCAENVNPRASGAGDGGSCQDPRLVLRCVKNGASSE